MPVLESGFAVVKDEGVVGDIGDVLDPVGGEKDGLAGAALVFHKFPKFQPGPGVEAGGRLIQDEEGGSARRAMARPSRWRMPAERRPLLVDVVSEANLLDAIVGCGAFPRA